MPLHSKQRRLTVVSRTQGNNRDVKSGQVGLDGYELAFEDVPVLVDGFRRMVRGLEFDICEMAVTTYLCAKEHGVGFTAIPVFLVRGFHHDAIVARRQLASPTDLEHQRVGVQRGYTVTTGVWARGILADEYGVNLSTVNWACTGDEHVATYAAPPNVTRLPAGSSLTELVAEGELAGAVGVKAESGLVSAIADPRAAAIRAFQSRGFYPINHLLVVRDELLAEEPRLAVALFEAFTESKLRYVERLRVGAPLSDEADRLHLDIMSLGMVDPLPYGIDANVPMFETLIDYATDQSIITRRPQILDLFHPSTHGLNG